MLRHLHFVVIICLALAVGSCNSLPDNAKYIPKNATVTVGIHTNEIGKKIAWNAITGSKLFEELKKRKVADSNATLDPEAMGIELNSVTYVYMKTDNRFQNGTRVTALIPLEDAGKWEAFVSKTFPDATTKVQGSRKDAMLAHGMYAGWSKELLIVMNTIEIPQDYNVIEQMETDTSFVVTEDADSNSVAISPVPEPQVDEAQLLAEMNNAFEVKKENSLVGDKRFTKLEKGGHDITVWLNYDEIMNAYGSKGMSGMMGLSLSNTLWKGAAFATGIDFEKGKITGDMLYYSPTEMKEIAKEMGKEKLDKELLDMLPLQNPNMAFGWHLSPKGLKGTLDKMGMLGFVNLALSQQNLTADYILEAFTGDMAMVVTDFAVKQDTSSIITYSTDAGDSIIRPKSYAPDANFLYAMKISKKENFNKLLQLAVAQGALTSAGTNMYMVSASNPIRFVANDKYFVFAKSVDEANAFLSGTHKKGKPANDVEATLSHPFGMYIDIQSLFKNIDASAVESNRDAVMMAESKKLLDKMLVHGGEFSGETFSYKASLHFINKNENSLLQLIDFVVRMSELEKQNELTASNYK